MTMMIRDWWLLQGAITTGHSSTSIPLVSDKPCLGAVCGLAARRNFTAAASLATELMSVPTFTGIPERQPTWLVESLNEFFGNGA